MFYECLQLLDFNNLGKQSTRGSRGALAIQSCKLIETARGNEKLAIKPHLEQKNSQLTILLNMCPYDIEYANTKQ